MFDNLLAGRIGLRTSSPPQLGQIFFSFSSAQVAVAFLNTTFFFNNKNARFTSWVCDMLTSDVGEENIA
jgi:hypothetical protein